MKRAEVLRLAEKCVCGGRDGDYGTPEDNFGTIAKLWTIYRGTTFTAKDVAMMMALLKIARIRSGHYSADSYVKAMINNTNILENAINGGLK